MGFGQPLGLEARNFVFDNPAPLYRSPNDVYETFTGGASRPLHSTLNVGEYAFIVVTVAIPDNLTGKGVADSGSLSLQWQWRLYPGTTVNPAGINTGQDQWGFGTAQHYVEAQKVLYPFVSLSATWRTANTTIETQPKQALVTVWGSNRDISRNAGREFNTDIATVEAAIPVGRYLEALPSYNGPVILNQATAEGIVRFGGWSFDQTLSLSPITTVTSRWLVTNPLPAAGGVLPPQRLLLPPLRNMLVIENFDTTPKYVTLNIRADT